VSLPRPRAASQDRPHLYARLRLWAEPAVAHLDDAVARSGVDVRVRDLDDRHALVVQLLEQVHDHFALGRVQRAGRFVGEQQARPRDHGARDGDELLLSAGKLLRIKVFLADDLEAVEDVGDARLALVDLTSR
jgi:hypothetical protein